MKLLDWFFAARPMLHLPVWTIYLVTAHYVSNEAGSGLSLYDLVLLLLLSLMTAGAYYVNQYFDAESDRINKKLGFLQLGYISPRGMAFGFIICSIIPLAISFVLSTFLFFLFCLLFLLSWLYSASPWRLKDRPFSGLLANAISFGLLIPAAAVESAAGHQTLQHEYMLLLYFFFAVTAIHLLTTIPDREGDKRSGKRTVAVVLPIHLIKFLAFCSVAGSAIVAYYSGHNWLAGISSVSTIPIVFSLVMEKASLTLFAAKLPILLLSCLAGWFYPEYLLFLVVLVVLTRLYYHKRFNIDYPSLR